MTTQSKFTYAYWRTDKPKEPGFSHELISNDTKNILDRTDLDTLEVLPFPGVDTIQKALQRNLARIPNHDFLGTRVGDKYVWKTHAQVYEQCELLGYGIMHLGLAPQVDAEDKLWRFVGIQSKNREEWNITNWANMNQGITTVALYDTLGPDALRFVCNQTELTTIFLQKDCIKSLCKLKVEDASSDNSRMHRVTTLVSFDSDVDQSDQEIAKTSNLKLITYDDVIAAGKEAKANKTYTSIAAKPDDVFMFSYTSGTTGDPKGVKLTHKMVLQCGAAVIGHLQAPFTDDDSYISYLPAAHSFEQCLQGSAAITGMKIGFFAGNVLKITEDLQILQPTCFPSVPRLYNRIYGKILAGVKEATGVKGWLVNKAINAKLENLKWGEGVKHTIYDKLVFNKMKALLGGKVRLMVTGSAPISGEVLDFLKICFCADILEGYGMTETSAASCLMYENDPETGIVGGPLQNVKVRLRDIPEMQYLHTDNPPRGEVCMWGPSVMKGYFRNPEKTAEALSHDGWIFTGDVGLVKKNGAIKIIDRAKNIFKLSQGEYIAPEKLENVYVQSKYILQSWIYGDSLRDYLVGFFVLDPMVITKWAQQNNVADNKTIEENEQLRQEIYDDLIELANANKFNSLEKPKQITLLLDPFTVESDILTPTMKIKRNIAKAMFSEQINKMYSSTKTMEYSKK